MLRFLSSCQDKAKAVLLQYKNVTPDDKKGHREGGGAPVRRRVVFMAEEVRGYGVIAAANERKVTNGEAAAALGLSVREIQRISEKGLSPLSRRQNCVGSGFTT